MVLGIIIAVVFIVIIVLAFVFSKKAIIRRALNKAPYKRIHEVQNGEKARIVGRIVYAGQVLTSPLSRRHCAAFHVEVQEYRRHGKSGSWVTVINDVQKGDIVVHDGMGNAHIEKSVDMLMVHDANYSSGTFNDATPELQQYLQYHGRGSTGLLGFNKQIRYKEGILEQGELIAAVGVGTWHSARGRNLNLPQDRLLVLGPDEKGKLYITDEPGLIKTDQPA
jgi:hypothetical protein